MRTITAALGTLLTVIQATPAAAQEARRFDPAKVYKVAADGSPSRGPADAPVTIVEFSDFYCRYCIHSQKTLEQIETLYPGKVRVVAGSLAFGEPALVGNTPTKPQAGEGRSRNTPRNDSCA